MTQALHTLAPHANITRRQVLKRGAVGAAALTGLGFPNIIKAQDTLKIGVLLPYSGVYAALGESITTGIELYLEAINYEIAGRRLELVRGDTEVVPAVGLEQARRMLESDRVNLVMGVVSSGVALALRDYFIANKTYLILANAGANTLTRAARSEYIYRSSFTNWQPAYPIGQYAAAEIGKTAFISVPDYAAGHESASAFKAGFEAGGGEVIGVQLTPFPNLGDVAPFMGDIARSGAELTYAFYSGSSSLSFVNAYDEFGLKNAIPLVGPGFLVSEDGLAAQGRAALGVRNTLHWSPTLSNQANQDFTALYRETTGQRSNLYAVMGWDTARYVEAVLSAAEGDTDNDAVLQENFANMTLEGSPCGSFRMDPDTHNVIRPYYLREVQETEDEDAPVGNVVLRELGEIADPGDDSLESPIS